jgi:hypothetical protein
VVVTAMALELALAQAQNPHMPQHVSIRFCSQIAPPRSALVDVLAQTPTHIPRPFPKTQDTLLTAHIARRQPLGVQ